MIVDNKQSNYNLKKNEKMTVINLKKNEKTNKINLRKTEGEICFIEKYMKNLKGGRNLIKLKRKLF